MTRSAGAAAPVHILHSHSMTKARVSHQSRAFV